jgi:hypothetical protein
MKVSQMRTLKLHKQFAPLLCAAVGRARLQHGLEASTVYCGSGSVVKSCTESACTKLAAKIINIFIGLACIIPDI